MNWWGKLSRLKRFAKPGLIALIPVFFGCDTVGDSGTEFDLDTNVDVKVIDFTLPSSNLYLDSLRTDGESEVIVGQYSDPTTGSILAEGYVQFLFLSGTLPGDSLSFDSLNLRFQSRESLPQTGSSTIQWDVYELSDTLFSGIPYLSSTQAPKSRQIGSYSNPNIDLSQDSIFDVRLDDSYGLEIYNFLSQYPDSARSHFFKGLGIVDGGASSNLISLDLASDTSRLTLYMTGPDTTYTAEFSFSTASYSYLDRDPAGSLFDGIIEKEEFDLPDGTTYLDPLAGITTTFSFQELEQFFMDNPRVLINSAILDFPFTDGVDRNTLDQFWLYFRRADGGIFGPAISNGSSDAFGNIVMEDNGYTSLQVGPATPEKRTGEYVVSPTLFFQSLYNNYQSFGKMGYIEPFSTDTVVISELVMISPDDVNFRQTNFNNSSINLRVFYTVVN